ncbi:hypothetical protein ERX27_09895 [Macrococcus brunensis]|uniref:Uncharacterized protein n=1 Tax=Macrococcus brunensis TaxID=198483 RepID=A0A4R6BB39_9STAP|nr:hypothetical protein [Macrococcus brunensis]TDL94179.1 hypothetical protein ERX27_09895 [Macrococcus brunensis]
MISEERLAILGRINNEKENMLKFIENPSKKNEKADNKVSDTFTVGFRNESSLPETHEYYSRLARQLKEYILVRASVIG